MTGTVGARTAVGQAVGVEDKGGIRRQDQRLLLIRRQPANALAAYSEQDPFVADLHLPRLAVDHEQRRVMAGVREGQLTGPWVVNEVRAAHHGRVGTRQSGAVTGRHGAAPLVQLAENVRGRLLVLGKRAQRGPELPHDGGRAGAPSLNVPDDDAHPPGGQRDDVVPVAADLGLDSLTVGLQRFGRHVAAGHLEAVQLRKGLGQQALLEHQGRMPLRLEQHRVVDGDRDPACDRAEQVAVVGAIPPAVPFGEPGQSETHDSEQLTPGVQRQRDHRDHPDVVAGPQAVRTGRWEILFLQVRDDDDLRRCHGLLAEMALRVPDLPPHGSPCTARWLPAAGVGLHPPDQRVALEEVDEAMVGELRDEHLGDMAEGRAQLQRAAQPLADALQQPDPVPFRQRALAGFTREDGYAVDGAG